MRKVEPTIKALLICLMCLFAFGAQAQKVKDTSGKLTVLEAKENLANQKNFNIPQKPEPFNPQTQVATPVQMQQVQALGNTSLVKTSAQKTGPAGKANVTVHYAPTPVPMNSQQIQQIKLDNGRDNRIEPPQADLSRMSNSCISGDANGNLVNFMDPVICSVAPNPASGMIDIAVGFIPPVDGDGMEFCPFAPEVDNGDGTLTIAGLTVYALDENGGRDYLGTVLESATFETTACAVMPLMVEPNESCDPIVATFEAETNIYIVNATNGVITAADPDVLCEIDTFTVTINPILTAQIVSNEGDACGTLTAALFAADQFNDDGTLIADAEPCPGTEATATCIGPGDTPSVEFTYPFTGDQCPPSQTVTGTPCTGCPCGGEVAYENVTTCTTADNDNGDGTINVSIPQTSCMITPEVPNGPNTFTIYSFDVYNPAGVLMTSLYESATLGASACDGLSLDIPTNNSCEPIDYTFTVETAINTLEILTDTTLIVSFGADPLCDVASFTVTVLPTLTADIVSDGGADCGTLTAGFYNAAGVLCEGTEETAMCINFGDTPSVELTDPYGCNTDPVIITGDACENCVCGGMVDYGDVTACSADNGAGGIDITSPELGCSINTETINADGSSTVYGFDFYQLDADGNVIQFIGSTFESATQGEVGCIGDLTLTYPLNLTCDAVVFNFAVVTAINYYDADGVFEDFVDDPSCDPELFSVTINPTLTAQIVDGSDSSAECGSFSAALFAEDGTQCGDAVDSAVCETDGVEVSVTLEDPFGCADAAVLTVASECDGCFPITIECTGCMCFPNGIDLDGDNINDLALETCTITSGDAGEGWALTASSGFLNPDGTPSTASVVDNGDGTYTFTSYVAADASVTYSATFANTDGDEFVVEDTICNACPPPLDEVPTVGEWGLIMLGLLMTITAVIGIRQRREDEVYA